MKKILVTVGTTNFDTLIKLADLQLTKKFNLTSQIADGNYIPKNHEYFRFSNEIEQYFQDADLIISHGGAGTIFRVLELNKKLVIVPNLERLDSHQMDICDYMSKNQHAAVCIEPDKLLRVVENAFNTEYQPYKTDEFFGVNNIREYLELNSSKNNLNEDNK